MQHTQHDAFWSPSTSSSHQHQCFQVSPAPVLPVLTGTSVSSSHRHQRFQFSPAPAFPVLTGTSVPSSHQHQCRSWRALWSATRRGSFTATRVRPGARCPCQAFKSTGCDSGPGQGSSKATRVDLPRAVSLLTPDPIPLSIPGLEPRPLACRPGPGTSSLPARAGAAGPLFRLVSLLPISCGPSLGIFGWDTLF